MSSLILRLHRAKMHYLNVYFCMCMVSLIFGIIGYISFYVNVLMKAMFNNIQVEEMTELSLGANALLSSIKRLQWKTIPSSELLTFLSILPGHFGPVWMRKAQHFVLYWLIHSCCQPILCNVNASF